MDVSSYRGIDDDPIVSSPLAVITNLNVSVLILVWYMAMSGWSLGNYIGWVRHQKDVLDGKPPTELYLVFCILAMGVTVLVVAPILVYSGKYLQGSKKKNRWLSVGILIAFFFTDVPLFALDWTIYHKMQGTHPVPDITLVLRSISFCCAGFGTWIIILMRGTKYMFRTFKKSNDLFQITLLNAKNAQRARDGITTEFPKSKVGPEDMDTKVAKRL